MSILWQTFLDLRLSEMGLRMSQSDAKLMSVSTLPAYNSIQPLQQILRTAEDGWIHIHVQYHVWGLFEITTSQMWLTIMEETIIYFCTWVSHGSLSVTVSRYTCDTDRNSCSDVSGHYNDIIWHNSAYRHCLHLCSDQVANNTHAYALFSQKQNIFSPDLSQFN